MADTISVKEGETPALPLGTRFTDAFEFAREHHFTQSRKGTDGVPYLSHLMAVASIALDHGASEDEAIAALLHDVVEDGGGQAALAEIREQFGNEVADIVWACSDTDKEPKPPWQERKRAYIDSLATKPEPVLLVSASDKLHNARAILDDYNAVGDAVGALQRQRPRSTALVLPRPGRRVQRARRLGCAPDRATRQGARPHRGRARARAGS